MLNTLSKLWQKKNFIKLLKYYYIMTFHTLSKILILVTNSFCYFFIRRAIRYRTDVVYYLTVLLRLSEDVQILVVYF